MRGNMGEVGDILLDDLEGLLREINDFSSTGGNNKPEDIPQSLERYVQFVANSGNIVFPWEHVRLLFRSKIMHAMEQFPGEACPNSELFVMERFDLFRSAPFTIQRLAELVMQPTRHYKKKEKFLRGLEKTVLVVSTVEPWSLDVDMKNGNDSGSDGEMDQTYSENDDSSSMANRTFEFRMDMSQQGEGIHQQQMNIIPIDSSSVLQHQSLVDNNIIENQQEQLQIDPSGIAPIVQMNIMPIEVLQSSVDNIETQQQQQLQDVNPSPVDPQLNIMLPIEQLQNHPIIEMDTPQEIQIGQPIVTEPIDVMQQVQVPAVEIEEVETRQEENVNTNPSSVLETPIDSINSVLQIQSQVAIEIQQHDESNPSEQKIQIEIIQTSAIETRQQQLDINSSVVAEATEKMAIDSSDVPQLQTPSVDIETKEQKEVNEPSPVSNVAPSQESTGLTEEPEFL